MTAAEHEAWLRSTGQYEAMKERSRQEDEARQTQVDEWRRAEAPLVEDLNAGGFAVKSVWDLVNTSEPYPDALPILLDHLQRSYPSRVREGIARAMATPKARFAWDILTRSYREETATDAKDGLAVAVAAAADDDVIGDVISLARDRSLGPSRLLLLRVLERSGDSSATATLMDLATDPDLEKEIRVILRRRKER